MLQASRIRSRLESAGLPIRVPLVGRLSWSKALEILFVAAILGLGWRAWRALAMVPYADFRLYFAGAQIGLESGWSHLYQVSLQRPAIEAVSPPLSPWLPFASPPYVAWMAAPLTLLPFRVAYFVWAIGTLAIVIAASQIAAPRRWASRVLYALAALTFIPCVIVIQDGQMAALVLLAVLVAWRLLDAGHDVAAGLVLTATLVKPQLVLLLPLALMLAGRRRAVLAWGAGAAVLGVASVASLGASGLRDFVSILATVGGYRSEYLMTFRGLLGMAGPVTATVAGIAALVVARAGRGQPPAHAMGAGLIGSLLFATYLNQPDFAMVLGAVWLAATHLRGRWERLVLLLVWASAEVAFTVTGMAPVWLLALGLLAVLAHSAYGQGAANPLPEGAGGDLIREPAPQT